MKTRVPLCGESSYNRSTRTDGRPEGEKRSVYSFAVEGGMYRSRREILMLEGGTDGRGEAGADTLGGVAGARTMRGNMLREK